jgi:hypothetical protein
LREPRKPKPPIPSRLHLLVAKAAPTIVVLQRRRAKQFHVFTIDARTLEITHGSWFTGKLYVERSDVSFCGRYMVYLAMGHGAKTWNGVCRLPRLTTVLEGRNLGTWFGGGYFAGQGLLLTNGWTSCETVAAADGKPGKPLPFQVSTVGERLFQDNGILYRRLERDGFVRLGPQRGISTQVPGRSYTVVHTGDDGWGLRPSGRLPQLSVRYTGYVDGREIFVFALDEHPALLEGASWANWDCLGSLWVAWPGRVERYTRADLKTGTPSFALDVDAFAPPEPKPKPPAPEKPDA